MLNNVQYNPAQSFNLFSITKAMLKGWLLTCISEKGLELKKDGMAIRFDIKVEMQR